MAQLIDDCFAFSGPLMPLEDMERLIAERITPVTEIETVPLSNAYRRVLAADLIAPVNLPPFDNSAVDGYAVRHADLNTGGDTMLKVSGRLQAGQRTAGVVNKGEAIRIFTGAPMPSGADTVFMQEDVQAQDNAVTLPQGLEPGANRRLAGDLDERRRIDLGERGFSMHGVAARGACEPHLSPRLTTAEAGNDVVENDLLRPEAKRTAQLLRLDGRQQRCARRLDVNVTPQAGEECWIERRRRPGAALRVGRARRADDPREQGGHID